MNGGAIALGHPLGATGAMILGTVLDELERRKLNDRADDTMHRRRHGHRDHHRAGVIMPKIDISKAEVRTIARYPGGLHASHRGPRRRSCSATCAD